jgi:glyoxylase-like metal-dependent hydrolase (beta-lactamase superfamily II)
MAKIGRKQKDSAHRLHLKMRSALFIILASLISMYTYAQQSKPGFTISPVADNIFVFTTYGEYQGTPIPSNSIYVVTEKGIVMLDAPWDTTQAIPLVDSIEKRHHSKVLLCIATHFHADKNASFDVLKRRGIATWSSVETYRLSVERKEKLAEYQFGKDTVFKYGSYTFNTYYPGEGHTKDNIVVWIGKGKLLHGGCFIKSMESTDLGNTADANVKEWKTSLQKLEKKFPDHLFVIPGHGTWTDNGAIAHTISLLP